MTNLNKPQTKLELLELFGKSRDQELDQAEAELLNNLLISDSGIRGLYRGFVAIESGLEEIAKRELGKSLATSSDMSTLDDTVAEIPVVEPSDSTIPTRKRK